MPTKKREVKHPPCHVEVELPYGYIWATGETGGTPSEMMKGKKFNVEALRVNGQRWSKRYPGKYIAINQGRVVAVRSNTLSMIKWSVSAQASRMSGHSILFFFKRSQKRPKKSRY